MKGMPKSAPPLDCPDTNLCLGVSPGAGAAQALDVEEGAEALSMTITDPDAKTEVGTMCGSCGTDDSTIKDASPDIQSPLLDFSDLSNHLGTGLDGPNGSYTTIVDPSAHTTPVEAESDAYGWEAELHRRQCCIVPPTSNPGSSAEGHSRQPCAVKRSLLHRVLSSIPSHRPSADSTTTP